MSKLFDSIGHAITSTAAVIFVLLMVICGMILFSHTLFLSVFPVSMAPAEKTAATWFMALGWELTVLITSVNTRHLNRNIPGVMAVCSGVIVLFFIQGFDGSAGWLVLMQRWFVAVLMATINWIYADLFYSKWKDRTTSKHDSQRVVQLEAALNDLQQSLVEKKNELDHAQRTANETQSQINELRKYRQRIERELTCPHCHVVHETFGTLHAHKGHCAQNPRHKLITS